MESLPMFLISALIVIIVPGPDMIFTMTRGIMYGRRHGAVSAMGVCTGLLTHTIAVTLGLAIVISSSPTLFRVITSAGGCYLIYLGIQSIRNRERIDSEEDKVSCSLGLCYRQGYLSNLMNPKIVIFFLAFLPQFISVEVQHESLQLFWLGLIFTVITLILYLIVGIFAGFIGSWLKQNTGTVSAIQVISGVVLIGLGLYVLIP